MAKPTIRNRSFLLLLLIWFAGITFGKANPKEDEKEKSFVIHAPVKNINDYEEVAKQAARLKPYGRVEVNISTLAEKGFHEIPDGRNFWYEYASYNPTPFKFFPDPKIAPFLPTDFVKKNRELLLAKAKILRKYDLEAAFWSYEPNFLPEEFFEKYPHMLGPRVDHPRRGNYPAFAPCISVEETQEMFTNMVAELLENVPEIHTFFFKTNDAGSGICWSDWQYTGPNGPTHCKNLTMGERMETLMNAFKNGADKTGEDISIYLTGSMFSDEEKKDIYEHLPEDCYFQSHNSDEVKGISSMIVGNFPVKGLFNPQEIIRNIESIKKESTNTVFVSFRASYDRDFENPQAMEKFIDLLITNLEADETATSFSEDEQLYQICVEWAGDKNAEMLFNAFKILNEAARFKSDSLQGASAMYWGVTERQITRPLVIAPQLLTAEEESYFMPYIFNPSEKEARMDYTDIHGAHRTLTTGAANVYCSKVKQAIGLFEKVSQHAPEKAFIQNMVKALKIHSSIFHTIGNFAEAQAIRDRNAEKLAMEPHRPNKTPTWNGDPDFQSFITVMRDELDNTQDLIDVLENGGMEFIAHADEAKYEDTFLLGPDLIEQLKLKRKIMLSHWIDIEGYLASPFK